jgi:hypothetical protein
MHDTDNVKTFFEHLVVTWMCLIVKYVTTSLNLIVFKTRTYAIYIAVSESTRNYLMTFNLCSSIFLKTWLLYSPNRTSGSTFFLKEGATSCNLQS